MLSACAPYLELFSDYIFINQKNPLHYKRNARDELIRGSTLIVSIPKHKFYVNTRNLFHHDNGITGPDWGHSELVFKCFVQRCFQHCLHRHLSLLYSPFYSSHQRIALFKYHLFKIRRKISCVQTLQLF